MLANSALLLEQAILKSSINGKLFAFQDYCNLDCFYIWTSELVTSKSKDVINC